MSGAATTKEGHSMIGQGAPVARLDARYSSEGAAAPAWSAVRQLLASAEVYWLSTTRAGGRPHVTPLISVWVEEAPHFCTGLQEQKASNLWSNPACAVTTGANRMATGLDVVVEGTARRIVETDALTALASAYEEKYGSEWRFAVGEGMFLHRGGDAVVFRVEPTAIFAFARGDEFSQTRFRWDG